MAASGEYKAEQKNSVGHKPVRRAASKCRKIQGKAYRAFGNSWGGLCTRGRVGVQGRGTEQGANEYTGRGVMGVCLRCNRAYRDT